jgi:hypothetical protein
MRQARLLSYATKELFRAVPQEVTDEFDASALMYAHSAIFTLTQIIASLIRATMKDGQLIPREDGDDPLAVNTPPGNAAAST